MKAKLVILFSTVCMCAYLIEGGTVCAPCTPLVSVALPLLGSKLFEAFAEVSGRNCFLRKIATTPTIPE